VLPLRPLVVVFKPDDDTSHFFPEEDTPPWSACGDRLQEPLSPPFRPVVPDTTVNSSNWSDHPWFSRVAMAVDPPPPAGGSAMDLDPDVPSAST
jgi:hypothetical protein